MTASILPTAKDFTAQHARRVVVAHSLVREAVQARPEWRETVRTREHAEQTARTLLSERPALVGEIAKLIDAGDIDDAMRVATGELEQLFARDPYLLTPSNVTRSVALAWLKRERGAGSADELRGIAERAGSSTDALGCWKLKYHAAHILAARGEDVAQISNLIDAANESAGNVI